MDLDMELTGTLSRCWRGSRVRHTGIQLGLY